MAMRQRGGGAAGPNRPRVGGVRPVFEKFKPVSEWQIDDESHLLILYLPGFTKDQIKVSTEGNNTIRVRGERLVAGNKWSRFLEDFQVPENGEINSIRAKYQGGSLTITVPKKIVDKPQEAISPKTAITNTTPKPQEAISSKTEITNTTPKLQEAIPPKTAITNTTPQKGHNEILPKIIPPVETSKITDEKKSKDQRDKEISEVKKDHIESKKQETLPEKKSEKSKEVPEIEPPAKKMEFEEKESKGKQTIHSSADSGAFNMESYKKAVKGLTELNEERQLLVNMGVAVLVIVALSAYVTYKFASGKNKD